MKRYDVTIGPSAVGIVAVEGSARLLGAMAARLGCALPDGARAVATGEAVLLRSGPESMLVLTGAEEGAALAETLSALADQQSCIVADVTDAHGWIGLSGPDALAVLAQGVALDLRMAAFAPGHVARTICFGVEIILHRLDANGFRIGCRASHAEFMEARLNLAAAPAGEAAA